MVTSSHPGKPRPPHSGVKMPVAVAATPGEIERRRALASRVMALRREIGPIGITTEKLVHEARDETYDRSD